MVESSMRVKQRAFPAIPYTRIAGDTRAVSEEVGAGARRKIGCSLAGALGSIFCRAGTVNQPLTPVTQ
jgi:hypothetical protein